MIFVFGISGIVLGLIYACFPRGMCMLTDGWKFKNAEPSEFAIGLNRFGGITMLIVGILAIIIGSVTRGGDSNDAPNLKSMLEAQRQSASSTK